MYIKVTTFEYLRLVTAFKICYLRPIYKLLKKETIYFVKIIFEKLLLILRRIINFNNSYAISLAYIIILYNTDNMYL